MSKKRYLVLGGGVGKAIAYVLAGSSNTQDVFVGDKDEKKVREVASFVNDRYPGKCIPVLFDVETSGKSVALFEEFGVIISALPAKYNVTLAQTAILAGTNFCDLGGVVEVTKKMMELNKRFPEMQVSVVPDCGLMPGLGIVIAKKFVLEMGGADSVEILVGGLPQKPQPPTFYQKIFHPEGLKHICYDMAPVLSDGDIEWVKPFQDYCQIDVLELEVFSKQFNGRVETFITSGASLAPWSFRDMGVQKFAEKTVRWPGFVDFFKTVPIHKFEQAVETYLNIPVSKDNPDLVWMRIKVKKNGDQRCVSVLDLFDEETGLTAMQRTTGFTTAVIAEMISEGKTLPGVCTPENAFSQSGLTELVERVDGLITIK